MTGLSVDTLRAWERRYEAVRPDRDDRGRTYTDAHVARLKQLAALVARGHAIGSIASLPGAALKRLLDGGDRHHDATDSTSAHRPAPVMEALERYDLEAIETTLNRYAAVLPPPELVFSVLLPLLAEIGRRWETHMLRPSHEHMVSATVRSVLGGLLRTVTRPQASPVVVFATLPGERHELGLLCAALLAAHAGYGVVYLGADVPAADIFHAAGTTAARAVIIGATTPGATPISDLRALLEMPAGIDLWIGGQASAAMLAGSRGRARHLARLEDVVPALKG